MASVSTACRPKKTPAAATEAAPVESAADGLLESAFLYGEIVYAIEHIDGDEEIDACLIDVAMSRRAARAKLACWRSFYGPKEKLRIVSLQAVRCG